jgi:hypothetical protein
MTEMCTEWMPELKQYLRPDRRLMVKVDKAVYGLIQSAKLWYKELTSYLEQCGFKKCKSYECILVKKTGAGDYIIVILYVNDLLILSGNGADRAWLKERLESKYKKVTSVEGD